MTSTEAEQLGLKVWGIDEINDVHVAVWPTNDLVRHDIATNECVCGPQVVPRPRPEGGMGWMYKHHSLDGRENRERD
ncbi:hypothetical protein [Corynebacterium heidelbergense]|uniref:Uncharacterized protein n=1 Tax=Corynebacterium heidelbergense TaxID=2055947 RepID=A0A364VBV1_9CORY|nr:hypothetical protein [Corynebacterium heidelbergense]RAV34130.1 hypothetical protein CWC39_04770 [Corynebacterium heidelbergense]WCZ36107.1 hypothetical protein CHEID_02720 [Corynebacterium heidelbergense]